MENYYYRQASLRASILPCRCVYCDAVIFWRRRGFFGDGAGKIRDAERREKKTVAASGTLADP